MLGRSCERCAHLLGIFKERKVAQVIEKQHVGGGMV